MGFISFNLSYYRNELQRLESDIVSPEAIYRAQQLLKILDDLLDEGYTELNETLEKSCYGVSRLRSYLTANDVEPFPIYHREPAEADVTYEQNEIELTRAINELIVCAKERNIESDDRVDSFL